MIINKSIIAMSLSALKRNKARSMLTALGIIIGTAIVIIVLSVGAGIKELILREISSISPETLYVEIQVPSTGTRTEKNANTASSIGMGVQITTLKIKDMNDGVKLPNISKAYALLIGQEKFTHNANEKTAMIFAVSSDYETIEKLDIATGRFYTDREDKSLSQVIVLGSELKTKLFGDSVAIGKYVKIKGKNFKVIGVADDIGTKYFMNMDELAYVPVQTIQKKIMGIDHLSGIFFSMRDKNLIEQTRSQLERVIRRNHNIKDPEKDDFVVRTMDESMDMINTITGGISILLFGIAAISLIVGGVGVMNVMYVSVTERTNEIGLKKAVGAKPFDVQIQFLQESVLISIIGGFFGIILGTFISWLVSFIAINLLNFDWPFIIDSQMISISFFIPVFIGIIFGYAPAKKAARMNPIDALKHSN